jgi:hypothetical protein
MKVSWFGLFNLYQEKDIKKKNRRVEKISKTSGLNKDNEKDTYNFTKTLKQIKKNH